MLNQNMIKLTDMGAYGILTQKVDEQTDRQIGSYIGNIFWVDKQTDRYSIGGQTDGQIPLGGRTDAQRNRRTNRVRKLSYRPMTFLLILVFRLSRRSKSLP